MKKIFLFFGLFCIFAIQAKAQNHDFLRNPTSDATSVTFQVNKNYILQDAQHQPICEVTNPNFKYVRIRIMNMDIFPVDTMFTDLIPMDQFFRENNPATTLTISGLIPLTSYFVDLPSFYDAAFQLIAVGEYAGISCMTSEETFTVSESGETTSIIIFPNPCTDILTVTGFNHELTNVTIMDMSGKIVFQQSLQNAEQQVQLNIAMLSSGVYILKAGNYTKKIIKN